LLRDGFELRTIAAAGSRVLYDVARTSKVGPDSDEPHSANTTAE
jgi:hypothetical protein